MLAQPERLAEIEPPSTAAVDDASCTTQVDRVMAMTHLPCSAHVALIGHHTLPSMLALLKHGCGAVRCLRPGAPSPDREIADLAWIVDVRGDDELDEALHAARVRLTQRGRVVVEGAGCAGLAAIGDRATAAGLHFVSFDHVANLVVLAIQPCLSLAA
ncbi:MAG: hypothetical protein WCP68_17990 [Enhydrobacter sp.]